MVAETVLRGPHCRAGFPVQVAWNYGCDPPVVIPTALFQYPLTFSLRITLKEILCVLQENESEVGYGQYQVEAGA